MAICASTTSLLLMFLMEFVVYSSHAQSHVFHVGKHDGWTLLPSESYSHWAQRNRFQINDELVFKYPKGNDSVLVVGEDDYNKCNKKNPIQTLIDGYSKFKFNRSGPFFFISGHDRNCEKGQKLIIVVLAAEHHRRRHPPSSAPSPSSAANTPAHAPPLQPPTHSPSPATYKPAPPLSHSPSPSPTAKTPTHAPPSHSPSPSPTAQTPTHAPPASPPSPAKTPAHAPPTQPPSSPPAPVSHQSPPPEAESPGDGAPQPDADANQPVFLPPHHAPAPAPASASGSGASFILTVGLAVISAWIVV